MKTFLMIFFILTPFLNAGCIVIPNNLLIKIWLGDTLYFLCSNGYIESSNGLSLSPFLWGIPLFIIIITIIFIIVGITLLYKK